MKAFVRFAVSFFVLCLILFSAVYFFGPPSMREAIRMPASPVGQLDSNATVTTPGQPAESK